ncbi:Ribonuclease H-like superfamily, partial [Sesbania bispinosa]
MDWIKCGIHAYGTVFLSACWSIWCKRNKVCFEGVAHRSFSVAITTYALNHVVQKVLNPPSHVRPPTVTLVKWLPPQEDEIALNVDGSSMGNPGPAGFGGLLRDHQGSWMKGFLVVE